MHLLLLSLILLWCQLFWTLVPTWLHGEYYGYGWFVPLLALPLVLRRWRLPELQGGAGGSAGMPLSSETGMAPRVWVVMTLSLLPVIALLRLVAIADPSWRPPLLLHALLVALISHIWLVKLAGIKVSMRMLPVTVFALTAVPYPFQFEQAIIHRLTTSVASLAREIFILGGRPVELMGEKLALGDHVVEISEGCSGIRSFQSLVMVALFFGETLLLSFWRRLLLVLAAAACALGVNTLRAMLLADLHFTKGPETANGYHDMIGHAAFIASSILLFVSARTLLPAVPSGRVMVRRTVDPSVPPASS